MFTHPSNGVSTVRHNQIIVPQNDLARPLQGSIFPVCVPIPGDGLNLPARANHNTAGLCLGLQPLFSESEEFGKHRGLGIIPGRVRRFDATGLHVPHVGWNQVEGLCQDPLLDGVPEGAYFYFVHSCFVEPLDPADAIGWTDYGGRFCSVARRDTAWGAQFHPEKSQETGKRLLRNFLGI